MKKFDFEVLIRRASQKARCLLTTATVMTLAFAWQSPAFAQETTVHVGHLIAVPGEPVRENVTVIVENGTIKAIEDGFADGENIVDLSDSYVLPGLIDMHTHVTLNVGVENNPLEVITYAHIREKAALALEAIPMINDTLNAGFTTVRNLGDPTGTIFELRDAINGGIIDGPRILAAKTQISVTGGQYDPAILGIRDEVENVLDAKGLCDGPYECRRVVRRVIAEGADVIKLRIAGTGGLFGELNVYENEDELRAIVETAHRLGRRVAAHVPSEQVSRMVLEAGVDTVEHGPISEDAFTLGTNAYLTPTLYAHKIVEPLLLQMGMTDYVSNAMAATGAAYRAGVPILFGSDSGAGAHKDSAREFALLVEAGLTPVDAIRAATITAAEALGLSGQIGSIEVGKAADVIAVRANPLMDVTTLEEVSFVMKGGEVIRQAE